MTTSGFASWRSRLLVASLVLDYMKATLRANGPGDLSEPIEVIEAALGDDAGSPAGAPGSRHVGTPWLIGR